MTNEIPAVPEVPEVPEASEDKEPIYFSPKRVSGLADTATILSWIVLVVFLGSVIAEIIGLRAQLSSQGIKLAQLLKEPSLYTYLFTNMLNPLLTGLGLFTILQGVGLGLNMLLEADINARSQV